MAEKTTSFYKGQIPIRRHGQTTCLHHRENPLDWLCETCYDVICAKCVYTLHKGHENILLNEVTPDNKRKIEIFLNETGQKQLTELQQEISSTQDDLDKHLDHFESVAEEVKTQGGRLKEDIDVLIAKTLSQLKHLEEENTQLFISYKTVLKKRLEDLEEQMKKCKETLQIGTEIQVFDVSKALQTKIILPQTPKLHSANFTPNSQRNKILEDAFGELILISPGEHPSQLSLDQHEAPPRIPVQTNQPRSELDQSQKGKADKDLDHEKEISAEIAVLSEWKCPSWIHRISPSSGGGLWTCFGSKLTHLNSKGEIQQEIRSPVSISDISVSPTTNNVWICSNEGVMELVSGELTQRFKTGDIPKCLCVTRDERVLIGTKHRIIEYTPRGKQGITTKTSLFSKPALCSPQRMVQCPVTKNVAVVDRDLDEEGGKGNASVVVLNKQLQQLHKYGEKQHNLGGQAFRPWDITYDSFGFLVIAEFANKCLHLLSGDGQYIRRLQTDLDRPFALCVDTKGILWVGFGSVHTDQNVKRLKYKSA